MDFTPVPNKFVFTHFVWLKMTIIKMFGLFEFVFVWPIFSIFIDIEIKSVNNWIIIERFRQREGQNTY